MGVLNNIIQDIEETRSIKLPACIFTEKGTLALDRALEIGGIFPVHAFYSNIETYFDFSSLEYVSSQLNSFRDILSEEDLKIINNLCVPIQRDNQLFFDFVGNIFYMTKIAQELADSPDMKEVIKITLLLWIYMTLIELFSKYVSEFLRENIKLNSEFVKNNRNFLSKFKNGEHPMLKILIDTLKSVNYIENEEKTMFFKNKLLRNRISHANIFYDTDKKVLYASNGDIITVDELKNAYQLLHGFLNQLILKMNGGQTDLVTPMKNQVSRILSDCQKIERSGILLKAYNEYIVRMRSK